MHISVNYFAFKVVTHIKLIQPEDVKYEKYINWCFHGEEVYNSTEYNRLFNGRDRETYFEGFTMREHLGMAINPNEIFLELTEKGGSLHRVSKKTPQYSF